jgi:hypothetical protein
MTVYLLEKAVDQLDSYLEANVAAKITDLNTRYTDDTLPSIAHWYKGSLPLVIPENPSAVIHGNSWTPVDQRADNLHLVNRVDLIVFHGHDDVEKRFRRLCRYILGFLEMCRTGESTIGYRITVAGQVTLTDAMTTAPFMAGMILPLNLEQIETY